MSIPPIVGARRSEFQGNWGPSLRGTRDLEREAQVECARVLPWSTCFGEAPHVHFIIEASGRTQTTGDDDGRVSSPLCDSPKKPSPECTTSGSRCLRRRWGRAGAVDDLRRLKSPARSSRTKLPIRGYWGTHSPTRSSRTKVSNNIAPNPANTSA
jgi:hypothetical protein